MDTGTVIGAAVALAFVLALFAGAVYLILRIAYQRAQERISRERVLARLRDPRFRRATNVLTVAVDLGSPEGDRSILWRTEGNVRTLRA